MNISWEDIVVANDETHHLINDIPFYQKKFTKVLKFHAPGLAAVADETGAYHINIEGNPTYPQRFLQTFGYYQSLASVKSSAGWLHIDAQGYPAYNDYYAWCGNFQEGLCIVQDQITRYYYHINTQGQRVYQEHYCYVGDYRDGVAVVCTDNGLHTHINKKGSYLHGKWFLGLDVFHKGVARAKDTKGWFHINKMGEPLYTHRYKMVEPYYNNVAHVEDEEGNLLTIDLSGKQLTSIYQAHHSFLHELSADLVGFWKTQTIYTAVKLGIFNAIPNSLEDIAAVINLQPTVCLRLLRALQELNLVQPTKHNDWQLTKKGRLLQPIEGSAMAAAAIVWGDSHYERWTHLLTSLKKPEVYTSHYFNQLADNEKLLTLYQQALKGYAEQDYPALIQKIDWQQHHCVMDAGGGTGTLLHLLLNQHEHLKGILLEMPNVIALVNKHLRCEYQGINLLDPWPYQADAIVLARVLHDWCDKQATEILINARASLVKNGKIYVLEMILEPHSATGGLLDLNMLVMTGGRERTLSDWRQLTSAAQLVIENVNPLSSVVNLLILANPD